MQILASGKVGSQRYANNDIAKPVPALDMIELGQQTQRALEETQGYSLSNEEGSSASQNEDLSIIDTSNISDYDDTLAKLIQTYVANNSYLDVDPSSTANNIILVPRKIANINSPDGTNYSKLTSLPFNFRDNLTFTFRAKDTNTNAVTISIPALAGLSGSIALIDEQGAALAGNAIIANKYYTITTTTVSTVKKAILRTTILNKASSAEILAGANDNNYITALGLRTQGKLLIQTQKILLPTFDNTTLLIPIDNSKPLITEGKEFASIAFTPKSALSTLKITYLANVALAASPARIAIVALFDSNTSTALGSNACFATSDGTIPICNTIPDIASVSTTPRTYSLRFGPVEAGATAYMNGNSVYGALMGGSMVSGIIIEEYL